MIVKTLPSRYIIVIMMAVTAILFARIFVQGIGRDILKKTLISTVEIRSSIANVLNPRPIQLQPPKYPHQTNRPLQQF